jgi:hypothetical protein
MYRHKMNSTQCSTNRLRSGCGGTETERKEMLAYRGAVLPRRPPKIEQEEDLLLPKRKIQLKENDDSHLQFLGCDSEDWPVINGNPYLMALRQSYPSAIGGRQSMF